MGFDAQVLVFDYDAYTRVVVPAFLDALATGTFPKWLNRAINERNLELNLGDATDLGRFCTYLSQDLSWSGPYDEKNNYDYDWRKRSCNSDDCPERKHCPFHFNQRKKPPEELLWLLTYAVEVKCLGPGQFVGRSMVVTNYWNTLSRLGIREHDRLTELLLYLGKRGFVIGYSWGFGYGINGWLNPSETIELWQRLDELPLPRFEPSFEAMTSFKHPHKDKKLYEQFGVTQYSCSDSSFEELSLSFVRTVARIATKENKGILWGNDVFRSEPEIGSTE